MKKMRNTVHLEGYVYDHSLQIRESGPNSKNPGAKYIRGKISVATDDNLLNIVDVNYHYVSPTTSKGNPNPTYNILNDIIAGNKKTVMNGGVEQATKVRLDSAIGLNEWYDKDYQLISVKENNGGFVHEVNALADDEKDRNKFEVDMFITNTRIVEADPDRELPEKLVLKGAIFDFRNNLLPVEFSVVNEKAIAYFDSLNISQKNPTFTKVQGRQISTTVKRTIVEEGAFGDSVREVTSSRKDSIITWTAREPYIFDDEETLLASELKEAMARRETDLAALKTNAEAYRNTSVPTPTSASTVAAGEFNF